ncbi:hypothetical protein [Salsuginibacillus kocurii]|nr:hypothetical protein [Salsuginibacillus kocurii]
MSPIIRKWILGAFSWLALVIAGYYLFEDVLEPAEREEHHSFQHVSEEKI